VLCSAAIVACATAPPPVMPAPVADVRPDRADSEEVHLPWSRTRPLVWADFRAVPPASGPESARTVYVLSYESRCRGTAFGFSVTALFLPHLSWVRRQVLESPVESDRILRHEQTHFDLTEVYARRMRRFFAEMYNPCGQTEEQLRASIDRFVKDEAEAQQRYDKDTRYGLAVERQRIWDRDVGQMLGALSVFGGS
jgi:hypothetical protein